MLWQRFIAWLIELFTARLAREVAMDLEAQALECQADRVARLRQKADKLRASGHDDLAVMLAERAATLSQNNNELMFGTTDPALPSPATQERVTAGERKPPPAPSPNGTSNRPRGRPRKHPLPGTTDGTPYQP